MSAPVPERSHQLPHRIALSAPRAGLAAPRPAAARALTATGDADGLLLPRGIDRLLHQQDRQYGHDRWAVLYHLFRRPGKFLDQRFRRVDR